MSKFYGYVHDARSCRNGAATRQGYEGITAAAQSYDGSVMVDLRYDVNGNLVVTLYAGEGSTHDEHKCKRLFEGTIAQLRRRLGLD